MAQAQFCPKTKSRSVFLEELIEYAERAFGDEAQQMINDFLYATLEKVN